MKRLVLLSLLLFPIFLFAQYPTFSNKQKLGVQTTGDGLIYRGDLEIPNYQPSNVNNAYFYLDTVRNTLKFYKGGWIQIYPTPQFDTTTLNVYLKISDTTAMLLPYFRDSDTTQLNLINRFALKLNISDTSVMLSPYLRKTDTISLSNRINLKFNTSDTTILSNRITTNANNIITINTKLNTKLDTIYVKYKNVVTRLLNKDTIDVLSDGYAINIIGDSINIDTIILDIRYPDRDSTNELQDIIFATTSGVVTISGGKVMNLDTLYDSVIDSVKNLIQDSIAAFIPVTEGYGINIIGDSINVDTTIIFTQSDTITLSNRIDLKLNISDTISLSNRIDTKLNITDTISLSNRIDTKLNISDTTNMLIPYFKDTDTSLLNLTSRLSLKLNATDTASLSNRIDLKLNKSDTVSLSNRINKKLDTIYIQYQNYLDTIVNKDTINISNTLTEGFGINIIADSINIDSAIILTTQQKQIAYVKNQSGVTMYKGQAVYSSGSTGDNKLVELASSSTEQTSSKTFGIVESESIPNGSHGYIITFGLLDKINTDNLTEGSSVYLSSTPGQLTTTKPQAPLHLVTIGVCIRRQQNNGSIFVKIQNGFELDELHDVRITSPVDKASLYYNSSEQLWRDTTTALLTSDTSSMLTNYLRSGVASNTYLPLAGGTLTGALNGTSATFTGNITNQKFNINSTAFSSYTTDGLFGGTATPAIYNPAPLAENNHILFGYKDAQGGQYVPRIGFTANSPNTVTKSSIGLEPISGDFTINGGLSNSEYLRILASNGYASFTQRLTVGSSTNYDLLNIHHTGDNGFRMSWSAEPNIYFFQIRPNIITNNVRYVFSQANANTFYDSVLVFNNGNVAINKLNPAYKLDINGTLGVTGAATFNNTSRFIGNVAINTTTAYKPLEVYANANDFVSVGVRALGSGQWSGIHFGYVEPNTDYRKSAIVFQRRDYTGGADASGSIHLLNVTQGQGGRSADLRDARLTIMNNGNVGINDTLPTSTLSVTGTLGVTGATTLSSTLGVTGNVGIGVALPSFKLQVNGSSTTPLNFINNTNNVINILDEKNQEYGVGGGIKFSGKYTDAGLTTELAGIRGVKLNNTSGNYSGQLEFYTRNNLDDDWTNDEKMIINNVGNIGIGTSSPNAKLDVRGSVIINEDSGDFDTRIESDVNANMVFVDAGLDRVGIGTGTPSKTLDVNGEVKIATVTATPTALLGKDASNVVGEVTDINQSGVMKVGSTTQNTSSVGIINVAHGLSYTPTKVIATIAQQSSYVIVCHGITSTNLNFTIYDSTDGTALNNVSVGFFWIAFK